MALEQPALNRNRLCGSDLRRDDLGGARCASLRCSGINVTVGANELPTQPPNGAILSVVGLGARDGTAIPP